ncbi:protein SRC2-like [Andrographis paniculata]|uniref:protein SRC2-like n=1 Tax=Andrographis paniculata TaxID=175694 RepID=UPI0021E76F96|nr:protein SRC2-like [Andrographis paniculata]
MGYEVEVTVASAKNLKNVNWRRGNLRPYAVLWIDPANKCSTRAADAAGEDPVWDDNLIIPFISPLHDATLYIDVVHAAAADDDGTKPIVGSAKLPLRDVVDAVGFAARFEKNLELKRPSGRPQGKVEVHVSVREPGHRAPEPYYAANPYGVPPPEARGYENPYGAAPPYGQPGGYYEQPGYYGQPAAAAAAGEEHKKSGSKFGMGTGLAVGAAAGLVGGVALAEGFDALEDHIADDVAERVEDDYADGGDDEDF